MSAGILDFGFEPLVETSIYDVPEQEEQHHVLTTPSELDMPISLFSLDCSPERDPQLIMTPPRPSMECIPLFLDHGTSSAGIKTDASPGWQKHEEASRWSNSTKTSLFSTKSQECPDMIDAPFPTSVPMRRNRSNTVGGTHDGPSVPPRPQTAETLRLQSTPDVSFAPRASYRKRESSVGATQPSSSTARPSTGIDPIRHRQDSLVPRDRPALTRPATAPTLRTHTSSSYAQASGTQTLSTPRQASPMCDQTTSRVVFEPSNHIVSRILTLYIDQEGLREVGVDVRFVRFDKSSSMFDFRPLETIAAPFSHSSLISAPVFRRLWTDNGGRRNWLDRQASLSVKTAGLHHVEMAEGKRKWRLIYKVDDRKQGVGGNVVGEKILTLLSFSCTADFLGSDTSVKHKILRAVKSAALPRLNSTHLSSPRGRPPLPDGFAWIPNAGTPHQHSPLAKTVRPSTSRTRNDSAHVARPRPSTAEAKLLTRG